MESAISSIETDNDSNWFAHVLCKFPSEAKTFQIHECTAKINWMPCSAIITNQEFSNFVVMLEAAKVAIFDYFKKGIIATAATVPVSETHQGDLGEALLYLELVCIVQRTKL